MIVAGIGCRKGSSATAVLDAISHALTLHGLQPEALDRLASGEIKRDEPGIQTAARDLSLPLDIVNDDALGAVKHRCLTHSPKSIEATNAPSLSEAAALAAAGQSAELLGPRIARHGVTCALARSEGRG